ncbi:WD40-repeat-containing domain protein [Mycena sp. CBHHK59/15]|nr:WD40-repeat-containing domain protein [Mycena sp. CBHHK59/15]
MLAITTTQQLTLVDPQALRRPPSSLPSCLPLLSPSTGSAWSPDNLFLFLSSSSSIHQYNPALNTLTDIYSSPENITHLVHVLESAKVVQIFDYHKAPITSLTLCNDLLASTSSTAAHVHNLSLGSHTVLRGLNLAGKNITACTFHPHSRARLLLGVGKHLLVYDTMRPSGPLKTIPINDAATDIVAVACSPFSKTLVAVASASGHVGLMDLDKEKALFRTLTLKVPLTSIAFSPEGASIYLGTENGKLLIMDLRALDKPPKNVVISETGCRVETMTVQKKNKGGTESSIKPIATISKVSGPSDRNNPIRRPSAGVAATETSGKTVPEVASSPSKRHIAWVGSVASPARRPSTMTAPPSPKPTNNTQSKKIFSPVRDPLGNRMSVDGISMQSTGIKATIQKGKETASSNNIKNSGMPGVRDRRTPKDTDSASTGTRLSRERATSRTTEETMRSASARLATRTNGADIRPRTSSSTARTVAESVSGRSARSRSGSLVSRPGSSASHRSAAPFLPVGAEARSVTPDSRTPSPDLPGVNGDPVTPLPIGKKKMATFGTPEVKRWIEAGDNRTKGNKKGKGKTVVFQDGNEENSPDEEDNQQERERNLSMQISPRRTSSAGPTGSASWAPSPLRNAIPASPPGGNSSAHDLLRSIVRDVMFDFHQEHRAEMTGLHLDLIRMGRGWKHELRGLMDEYVGDLKELREENKRLREENDHLRRGY